MLKLIAFGDLVENESALRKLTQIDYSKYDFALFTGDILSMETFKKLRMGRILRGEIEKEKQWTKKTLETALDKKEMYMREIHKLKKLKKYFEKIRDNIPLYGVWGNADSALMISEAKMGNIFHNIHLNMVKISDFSIIGYEGRPKYIFEDYENPNEHTFDEEKAHRSLFRVLKSISNRRTILVTHAPPYKILDKVNSQFIKYGIKTYGERAKNGNIGCLAFKRIDDKYRPLVHIFGHIHECKGIKRIRQSVFVNTGSFGITKELTIVEINDNDVGVKFKKIYKKAGKE